MEPSTNLKSKIEKNVSNVSQKPSRDYVLDLLRGYFLFVIGVNHLNFFPNVFEPVTGRAKMWATSMEGFVFVSGYLVGLLRGYEAREKGFSSAAKKMLHRAFQLYYTSVAIIIIAEITRRFGTQAIGLDTRVKPTGGNPVLFLFQALLLQPPGLGGGLLPMYAVFLLVSPIVIWLLLKSAHWLAVGISFAIYLLARLSSEPIHIGSGSGWDVLCWQFLFFLAVVIGYHSNSLRVWWYSKSDDFRKTAIATAGFLTVVTLTLSWLDSYGGKISFPSDEFHAMLLSRVTLGPLRLMVFLVWFGTLYALVKAYEKQVVKYLGWFLLPIGQHSLHTYILQLLFLMVVGKIGPHGFWINTLVTAAAMMAIWAMVKSRVFMKIIPN